MATRRPSCSEKVDTKLSYETKQLAKPFQPGSMCNHGKSRRIGTPQARDAWSGRPALYTWQSGHRITDRSTRFKRHDFTRPVRCELLYYSEQSCSSQSPHGQGKSTKVRICASFSTIGAHLAFEERFVRPYDRRLGQPGAKRSQVGIKVKN